MALIKERKDPTGVTASYFIIDEIEINKISMTGTVSLSGYKSREQRLEYPSEGVIQTLQYTAPPEDFEIIYERVILGGENLYVLAYDYIKGTEKDLPDSVEPDPVYWTDAQGNLSFFSDAKNDFNDINASTGEMIS